MLLKSTQNKSSEVISVIKTQQSCMWIQQEEVLNKTLSNVLNIFQIPTIYKGSVGWYKAVFTFHKAIYLMILTIVSAYPWLLLLGGGGGVNTVKNSKTTGQKLITISDFNCPVSLAKQQCILTKPDLATHNHTWQNIIPSKFSFPHNNIPVLLVHPWIAQWPWPSSHPPFPRSHWQCPPEEAVSLCNPAVETATVGRHNVNTQ